MPVELSQKLSNDFQGGGERFADRRELLAMVTFVKHFRPYLLGRTFSICTDHGSLGA